MKPDLPKFAKFTALIATTVSVGSAAVVPQHGCGAYRTPDQCPGHEEPAGGHNSPYRIVPIVTAVTTSTSTSTGTASR